MDSLTVEENIMLPMILGKGKSQVIKEKVHMLSSRFQIEKLLYKHPYELSGGEKQRTAICRALMNEPDLILADEPTGNLDSKTSQDVLSLLKVSSQKFAQTIVIITHNEEIAQLSDRIIRIEDGLIVTGR